MPVITDFKPQKNGRRVNVYLDGKFGFGIDLENFVALKLKNGNDYTEKEIVQIVKKAEYQKILDKLINYCLVRPRSEREVGDWLKRKRVHEGLWNELKAKLIKLELLDDFKFATWWVEQRSYFKPRGSRALKSELFGKGIDRKIVEKVLTLSPINEEKIARELLAKNDQKWKRYEKKKIYTKKAEFLVRKGIGWDTIRKVLKIDQDF